MLARLSTHLLTNLHTTQTNQNKTNKQDRGEPPLPGGYARGPHHPLRRHLRRHPAPRRALAALRRPWCVALLHLESHVICKYRLHSASPPPPNLTQTHAHPPPPQKNNNTGTRLRILRCLLPTLEALPAPGHHPPNTHEWCPEFTSLVLAIGAPKLRTIEIRRSVPNAFPRAGALSDVALLAATPALENLTLTGLFTPPASAIAQVPQQPQLSPAQQQQLLLQEPNQNPQSDEGFVALLEAATAHHRTVLPSLTSLIFEVRSGVARRVCVCLRPCS